MSYIKEQNAQKRAEAKHTEALRHLRNARTARIAEAQAYLDKAAVQSANRYGGPSRALVSARATIDQAEAINELWREQDE